VAGTSSYRSTVAPSRSASFASLRVRALPRTLAFALLAIAIIAAFGLLLVLLPGGSQTPIQLPTAAVPAPRTFVLGRRIGDLAAGIAAAQRDSSLRIDSTILAPNGDPARGYTVSYRLFTTSRTIRSETRACGAGCYRAVMPLSGQPLHLRMSVEHAGRASGFADFPFPAVWPPQPADRLLGRASRAFLALKSVVVDQHLTSGASLQVRYKEVAPDRMAYTASNGAASVNIGTRNWDRNTRTSAWIYSTLPEPLKVPFLEWDRTPVNATLLGSGRLRGRPVWLVSHEIYTYTPIWYTVAIDKRTGLLLDTRMVTSSHFMHDRYSGFNQPLAINPPPHG
jgi:hypothetical protein